jgi:hypothetical protein
MVGSKAIVEKGELRFRREKNVNFICLGAKWFDLFCLCPPKIEENAS